MFCTRCGANNIDSDQVCRSCGAPLIRPGGAQGHEATSGSGQQPYPYSTPGPGSQSSAPQGYEPYQGQQPYPGYQGHPSSQYGYANQMSTQQGASGRAIAAMIVSIASLMMCCFPASIVGLVLGKMEMNAIQEGRAPRAGETMAKIGFYVGIAGTAISALVLALRFLGALAGIFSGNFDH